MTLAAGETVSYETRADGLVYVYRSLGGVKVDLGSGGQVDLATAKTNANTTVANHKTAIGTSKTGYNNLITDIAAAADGTHAGTNNGGAVTTINEYTGTGKTYYVESTEVAAMDTLLDSWVASIVLDETHDDDLTTAITALA